MCMEDITLGRRTVSNTTTARVAAGGIFVIPANGRRVGLLLSASISGAARVFREVHTAAQVGDTPNIDPFFFADLSVQNPNFLMRIEQYGIAVQLAYTMQSLAGAEVNYSYTEFILLE